MAATEKGADNKKGVPTSSGHPLFLILAARMEFTPMILIGASRRFVSGHALCVPMLFIGTTSVPIPHLRDSIIGPPGRVSGRRLMPSGGAYFRKAS